MLGAVMAIVVLTSGCSLWAWGYDPVGDGSGSGVRVSPTQVNSATDWDSATVGYGHRCGLRSGGLWCWGSNSFGEVGDGSHTQRLEPVQIGSATDWSNVSAGGAVNT